MHYHKRWDIELCFDEIKTHQCATPRGQMPTLFRSKRPELVEQELYAMMLVYNLLRELMVESATPADKDPLLGPIEAKLQPGAIRADPKPETTQSR